MATSHIPIYYENQLVGSISIAEFITQPRFGNHTFLQLLILTNKELHALLPTKKAGLKKQDLINVVMLEWLTSHSGAMKAWEHLAYLEIKRVFLSK